MYNVDYIFFETEFSLRKCSLEIIYRRNSCITCVVRASSILFGKFWRKIYKKRTGKCHLAAADSAELVAAAVGVPSPALHAGLA
jgi:hypothetical protein